MEGSGIVHVVMFGGDHTKYDNCMMMGGGQTPHDCDPAWLAFTFHK